MAARAQTEAAGSSRSVRAWAALLIVGLVAWRGAAGLHEAWQDLARRPWREHARLLRARPEALIARRLGEDARILSALRAHAPGAPEVRVSFAFQPKQKRALRNRLTKLESLAYPTVLAGWPHDPRAGGPSGPLPPGLGGFVLDLDSGRDYSAFAVCDVLAEGRDWKLLRVGTGSG